MMDKRRHTLQRATVANMQLVSITHELAQIFAKIERFRQRVLALAAARALTRAAWYWLGSLLVLGTVAMLVPWPTPLRLTLLVLHGAAVALGAWRGARYIIAKSAGGRKNRLRRWALRCEESYPMLNDRLVTCVDFAQEGGGAEHFQESPVAMALLKDTSRHFIGFDPDRKVPARHIQISFAKALLPLAVFALLALVFRPWPGQMATALYFYKTPAAGPAAGAADGVLQGMDVQPGNVEVPRGASVSVEATLRANGELNFTDPPVLETRVADGSGEPDMLGERSMIEDADRPGTFYVAVHDVQSPTDYQVSLSVPPGEHSPGERVGAWLASLTGSNAEPDRNIRRGPLYTITPFDPPAVKRMAATLRYPSYTRLPLETVEGSYIAALTGTEAVFRAEASTPLSAARLVAEDGSVMDATLETGEDGALNVARFDFLIDGDQSMRLELDDRAGHHNLDPPLVVLHAREDEPPTVQVNRPGADWAVHPIAEITFDTEAKDDYGLKRLRLAYQINGAAEEERDLFQATSDETVEKSAAAQYTLALEDLHLVPGDSILYRFVADDLRVGSEPLAAEGVPGRGFSQPYFLSIRPFDGTLFKGGPASGGGAPAPNERQVIVATLRFADRRDKLSDAEQQNTGEEIARTQREVRVLMERLRGKLAGAQDVPNLPERLNHLDQSIEDMNVAEALLSALDPRAALPPENSALQHQLAAFAGLPEFAGWMNDAVPSPYAPDPDTALAGQKAEFEKDNYELFQPAQSQARDEALNEALEKTRAMAQRQKEYLEEIARELWVPNAGAGSGPGGKSSQSAPASQRYSELRQQAEEQRRELERLREALQDLDALDSETAEKIREALERTARELAEASAALDKPDLESAKAASARAQQELLDLEQVLAQSKDANSKAQMEQLAALIDRWKADQEQLRNETKGLGSGNSPQAQQSTAQQQRSLSQQVGQAAQGMAGSAGGIEQARQNLQAAARWMDQAATDIDSARTRDALKGQDSTLEQLQAARDAVESQLALLKSSAQERAAEALHEVLEFKDYLDRALVEYKDRTYIPEVSSGPPPSAQSDVDLPDAPLPDIPEGPPVAPDVGEPPRIIASRMGRLQGLLDPNSQAGALFQQLQQSLGQGGSGWGDSGVIELMPLIIASLEDIEEVLRAEMQVANELQRLRQPGSQDLPPEFRAMAAKYFEALGAAPADAPQGQ